MYDPKRNPNLSATNLFTEFYEHVSIRFPNPNPNDAQAQDDRKKKIVDRGKALFGDLAHALEAYYAERGPGADEAIRITLRRGHGRFYDASYPVELDSANSEASQRRKHNHHNGVISDIDLIGVEGKALDRDEIWVAAPDLSNVGDETSLYSETS